jgi:hypothetical protein
MDQGGVLAIVIPSATVLAGILINNSRISDLNGRFSELHNQIRDMQIHIDHRFTSMEKIFDEKLKRVEDVLDARLTRI